MVENEPKDPKLMQKGYAVMKQRSFQCPVGARMWRYKCCKGVP